MCGCSVKDAQPTKQPNGVEPSHSSSAETSAALPSLSRASGEGLPTVQKAGEPIDSVDYDRRWNMGDDLDDPDKNVDTRFVVRARIFRSGVFTLVLDTIPRGASGLQKFKADSVSLTGLIVADRVTQSCRYGSRPWVPIVAIQRDSVYERRGHPRAVWLLDSANARIRPASADSVLCFIPGPD